MRYKFPLLSSQRVVCHREVLILSILQVEAAEAARYASQVDNKIHSVNKLHREAEGHESSAFKALFGGLKRT